MEPIKATDTIKFVNPDDPLDIVYWNFKTGVFMWNKQHKETKPVRYIGDNGEKVEIEWKDGKPVPYWGWW